MSVELIRDMRQRAAPCAIMLLSGQPIIPDLKSQVNTALMKSVMSVLELLSDSKQQSIQATTGVRGIRMNDLIHVMYVEDDPDIRAVAKLALEMIGGMTVSLCERGDIAVAQAESFQPQMILLDVMMPGMDGPTTLKALREHPQLQSIPIVFMTAKVQTHELIYFKSLGAAGVIPKPFSPMTLAQQVRDLWHNAGVAS